jgi:hypothetical protein
LSNGVLIALGLVIACVAMAAIWEDRRRRAVTRREPTSLTQPTEPAAAFDAVEFERPVVSVRVWTEITEFKPDLPAFGTIDGPVFQIEYKNADDEISERVIRLRDVSNDEGRFYIVAHCFLARDERTFRADRIQRLYDHRTGAEIPRPAAFFADFAGVAEPKKNDHTLVMGRARPGLAGLLWIARADGALSNEAIDIMLDYIEARRHLPGARAADLEWDIDFARRWIESERPTFDVAMGAIGRMRRGGNEAKLFRDFSEKLPKTAASEKRREKVLRGLV